MPPFFLAGLDRVHRGVGPVQQVGRSIVRVTRDRRWRCRYWPRCPASRGVSCTRATRSGRIRARCSASRMANSSPPTLAMVSSGRKARRSTSADRTDQRIAGGVPVGVVDRFQPVDVDVDHRQIDSASPCRCPRSSSSDLDQPALVGQPGQLVGGGQPMHLEPGLLEPLDRPGPRDVQHDGQRVGLEDLRGEGRRRRPGCRRRPRTGSRPRRWPGSPRSPRTSRAPGRRPPTITSSMPDRRIGDLGAEDVDQRVEADQRGHRDPERQRMSTGSQSPRPLCSSRKPIGQHDRGERGQHVRTPRLPACWSKVNWATATRANMIAADAAERPDRVGDDHRLVGADGLTSVPGTAIFHRSRQDDRSRHGISRRHIGQWNGPRRVLEPAQAGVDRPAVPMAWTGAVLRGATDVGTVGLRGRHDLTNPPTQPPGPAPGWPDRIPPATRSDHRSANVDDKVITNRPNSRAREFLRPTQRHSGSRQGRRGRRSVQSPSRSLSESSSSRSEVGTRVADLVEPLLDQRDLGLPFLRIDGQRGLDLLGGHVQSVDVQRTRQSAPDRSGSRPCRPSPSRRSTTHLSTREFSPNPATGIHRRRPGGTS